MMQKKTLRQFWCFGIAGGVGFLVDVAVLYLAMAAGAGFYLGRVLSFFCATYATWQINRNFAFSAAKNMSLWREWWRYVLAVTGGGTINYVVSVLTAYLLPSSSISPLISVAMGSLAGMVVNFFSTKILVFRQK